MPDWLVTLLRSGAVWSALIALLNIVAKVAFPNLSVEILTAVNILVIAILAALGINVESRLRKAGY